MKKLSYNAKSTIFLLLSLIPSIIGFWVDSPFLDIAWGILWGIGLFFWGAAVGERKAQKSRNINVYFSKHPVDHKIDLVH